MKTTVLKNPHAVALGRKGGKSRSDRKLAAVGATLERFRGLRWPKKPQATDCTNESK